MADTQQRKYLNFRVEPLSEKRPRICEKSSQRSKAVRVTKATFGSRSVWGGCVSVMVRCDFVILADKENSFVVYGSTKKPLYKSVSDHAGLSSPIITGMNIYAGLKKCNQFICHLHMEIV